MPAAQNHAGKSSISGNHLRVRMKFRRGNMGNETSGHLCSKMFYPTNTWVATARNIHQQTNPGLDSNSNFSVWNSQMAISTCRNSSWKHVSFIMVSILENFTSFQSFSYYCLHRQGNTKSLPLRGQGKELGVDHFTHLLSFMVSRCRGSDKWANYRHPIWGPSMWIDVNGRRNNNCQQFAVNRVILCL